MFGIVGASIARPHTTHCNCSTIQCGLVPFGFPVILSEASKMRSRRIFAPIFCLAILIVRRFFDALRLLRMTYIGLVISSP